MIRLIALLLLTTLAAEGCKSKKTLIVRDAPTRVVARWLPVGAPGCTPGVAESLALCVDAGLPYLAYREGVPGQQGGKPVLLRFDGAEWQRLGAPGTLTGNVFSVSLALDKGVPYLACKHQYARTSVSVLRWDKQRWTPAGPAKWYAGQSWHVQLAAVEGGLYLAARDKLDFCFDRANVWRLAGWGWTQVGAPRFSQGLVTYSSFAAGRGMPHLAYNDSAYANRATVMRFDGRRWVPVGMPGFSAGQANYTTLAFRGGEPWVAYQDVANGWKATVVRYNGTNWLPVGMPGFTSGAANDVALAMDGSGTPHLAWSDAGKGWKAMVAAWDGTNWTPVGSADGLSDDEATDLSLVYDGQGTLYLAFQDASRKGKATVLRLVRRMEPL